MRNRQQKKFANSEVGDGWTGVWSLEMLCPRIAKKKFVRAAIPRLSSGMPVLKSSYLALWRRCRSYDTHSLMDNRSLWSVSAASK